MQIERVEWFKNFLRIIQSFPEKKLEEMLVNYSIIKQFLLFVCMHKLRFNIPYITNYDN